eukprot:CAMPEP_0173279336 /NCGR_PEP_ID=MMETSP1143-20121109/5100_1 /TAXON_ID=483371 /ORGANISM="non described non described, Strain CCMP2298" /LENGTH=74 /DNA_ID=CAMNT_0014216569 /DNA_START=20 /DNA_END=244 /DNA_ORIENTATION=-
MRRTISNVFCSLRRFCRLLRNSGSALSIPVRTMVVEMGKPWAKMTVLAAIILNSSISDRDALGHMVLAVDSLSR